jgi:Outer membrane protein beta-barrel domain
MKTFYTILSLLAISLSAKTQTNIEIAAGPSLTDITAHGLNDNMMPNRTLHTGLQAQILAGTQIGNHFEFVTGLAYKEKGFHIREGISMNVLNIPVHVGVEAITTFRYLEVPLNLKYTATAGLIDLFAFAGPTVGYAMSADVRTRANLIFDFNISKTNLDLNQNIYNRLEIGGNAGLGIGIPVGAGSVTAQVVYSQGFSRVIDNTLIDLRLKNYGFGMNIGYKISL